MQYLGISFTWGAIFYWKLTYILFWKLSFHFRHIYIPLGGSQYGFLWQCVASFSCFSFVYYWHGAEGYLFTWTALNFVGITLESASAQLSTSPSIVNFEVCWNYFFGVFTCFIIAVCWCAFNLIWDTDKFCKKKTKKNLDLRYEPARVKVCFLANNKSL